MFFPIDEIVDREKEYVYEDSTKKWTIWNYHRLNNVFSRCHEYDSEDKVGKIVPHSNFSDVSTAYPCCSMRRNIISPKVWIATPIRKSPRIRMMRCVPASQSFFMRFPQNMTIIAVMIAAENIAIIPLSTPFPCIDMTYAIPGAEKVRGNASGMMSHLLRYSWMRWSHSTLLILVLSASSPCTIEKAIKKRMIAPAIRKYSVLSPKNASRYCPITKVPSIAMRSTSQSRIPSFRYSFWLAFGCRRA